MDTMKRVARFASPPAVRRSSLWIVFGAAICVPWIPLPGWAAGAQNALKEVRTVVERLQTRYKKTADLKADFKQSTRVQGFSAPITSTGHVYIKKPGKLRWDYRDPTVEEIYVSQDHVSMYVPEHKQVLVGNLTTMTASRAPLRLLQGIANLEEEFKIFPTDGARGAGGLPLVTLVPKPVEHEAVRAMNKIVVEVQPKTYFLKKVAIHEVTGNISTFEFTNIRSNTGLKDEVFQFKVPAGVEVVKAPTMKVP